MHITILKAQLKITFIQHKNGMLTLLKSHGGQTDQMDQQRLGLHLPLQLTASDAGGLVGNMLTIVRDRIEKVSLFISNICFSVG